MSVIETILNERKVPSLLCFEDGRTVTRENFAEWRQELLSILDREIYGTAPAAPASVRAEATVNKKKYGDCAGKAVLSDLSIEFDTDKGPFTLPAVEIVPKSDNRVPVFVLLNFMPEVPHKYLPAEEIVDGGCAVVRIYYNDVSADKDDGFSTGLAAMYDREKYTWGKIRMWAFAASRVMDYLETTDYADLSRVAVIGHSRLGKTALVAAAYDERFAYACSNNSGCSGAAMTRGKIGENVEKITRVFPHWFCEKYRDYADREGDMPFDQHFLVGAIAPRYVSIGSAVEDKWADPDSEYLTPCAASSAWELFGERGLVHPDRLPEVGDVFADGRISYHLRAGTHYLSRSDWQIYLDIMKKL